MVTTDDYGEFETAWCPGCGNFSILKAMKKALAGLGLAPHQVCLVSGIGQAAKAPHYLRCNAFNGLHGRALPPAQAIKMANPKLTVIAESGDGCSYGEGGNHFLAAVRRNMDITLVAHDNQIYGLTKGQASPTSLLGMKTKAQPFGAPSMPFNPVGVAVAMRAGFVARGFAGEIDHLAGLIEAAVRHPGFSLVDVFQPCVSFNKLNTYAWYKERVRKLDEEHDPTDWQAAMNKAFEMGETIPIGVLWRNDEIEPFASRLPTMRGEPLATRVPDLQTLDKVMHSYG
ncbi:pyruvate ferredoxin/flavodoxin oxidoreductase, beta subunit [Desulfovibrio sp. X2]|uniref:thiamine pyrophosphate-dependent enzyme n=1 Tax=Desulfovibrio sp. X2 TaxID=941449 RepID=UPI0003587A4F|nr:thiamine pyrophosphate-dependent enzyme [Desulfovibrio sp. X2]EPR37584.1 pyruvate ferredoxin/flavodoxin oxidoreductase, beta subunit [Desulfovibrio sp. X2]